MAQNSCPECGNLLQGYETTCPECGFPVSYDSSAYDSSYYIDAGDNDAEDVLRNVVNFIKKFIIFLAIIQGVIMLIAGIIMLINSNILSGVVLIIAGMLGVPLGIYIAKLIWAVGMIFINISTNVRNIKQILKNN